ncbi:MipA/OmpV family protein [Phenylobacterium sp. J367]|uniref:MipA/OmpV family protein n=1 Tax=Phenylobacterium sp. J367 TaxID=2898435 RepID=UPI0021510121|nr:MipA/OmpV family protein [Phenylobacterium sp. J367]MCR5880816.1 MipA/OmpV family protein [Phenylobacterium sp. J367]
MPFRNADTRRVPVRPFAFAAAVSLALLAAGPAAAQGGLEDIEVMGWSLNNVRAGVRLAPDYVGSDDYKLYPTGSLNLYRRGSPPGFGAPDDGISVGLFGDDKVSAGVVGRWRSSREDDGDLEGFDKVDGAVEAGVFAQVWPAEWARLRVETRRGFGGHESWLLDLRGDAVARQGPWIASIGPRFSWADKDYTETYFAVTPQDAARSPLGVAAYAPDGATRSVGLVSSVEYRVQPRWSLTGSLEYRRLLGDAADSPIVEDLGSSDQFSATVGVRYWFGR